MSDNDQTIYTREELEQLYNDTVYPHIQNTGKKIASYYKHKHQEDYEDIMQLISMDMWRVLEKLLTISDNSASFMRILTSAVNFSFRTHYGKLKKTIYVPYQNKVSLEEFEIESPSDIKKLDILLDINDVTDRIAMSAMESSRFVGKEGEAVDFCVRCLLIGREPGEKIIGAFYGVQNPAFMIDYAKYLIRLAIFRLHKELGG